MLQRRAGRSGNKPAHAARLLAVGHVGGKSLLEPRRVLINVG